MKDFSKAIRVLAVDAITRAKSGHPGMPLGMADIAAVLWKKYLNHNPLNPAWKNRDRFILSNGHGSMLHYSLLHLTGYKLTIDDLKNFRVLSSKTPGHPEVGITPGVEVTTGPLGQGIANAVGMAIATEKYANRFNKLGFELFNNYTYCFAGDGCLMEGISHEACSIAGTLGLGRLIVFWDDNGISIDGNVEPWFSDDTVKRFKAYNWQVIENVNGHNYEEIEKAILLARRNIDSPTLICTKTKIGYKSVHESTPKIHGVPLNEDEVAKLRNELGWNYDSFEIPKNIYQELNAEEKGKALNSDWDLLLERYGKEYSLLHQELLDLINPSTIMPFDNEILKHDNTKKFFNLDDLNLATRKASNIVLEKLRDKKIPLIGGSCDLSTSNLTKTNKCISFDGHNDFNYIDYGVREFAMGAIMNGIALFGGYIPYGGTFLVFSDYMRSAIRMSALMNSKVIYVLTHDSIGLGEDGPTHQPIEHLAMLRATPNLRVYRPCDIIETLYSWKEAINEEGPSVISLSRQKINCIKTENLPVNGYRVITQHLTTKPLLVILATGSEVPIAVEVANNIQNKFSTRVISMICMEDFFKQDHKLIEEVLPVDAIVVAIEAGATMPWYRLVGKDGLIFGIDTYGDSGKCQELYSHFGFSANKISKKIIDTYY